MPVKRDKKPLLCFDDKGLFCEPAGVYLDPWRPVEKAIITHGHADHSRWGHQKYITHHSNVPIIRHRLGEIQVTGKAYGENFTINNVKFSFHPAGHIIGSSQVRVEHKGEVWVFSGDYKTTDDGISTPFEAVKCHAFITECTFGLPAFRWQPQEQVIREINQWWRNNKDEGKTSVLLGYSLGKAQRLLHALDPSIGKIFTHGAIENMTDVLRPMADFPETIRLTREIDKADIKGGMVLAPPSAHGSRWIRRMVPYETGMASGWMAFRGARRRRAVDRGFVLSDHADWQGLLSAISATGCERVVCTHGYSEIFCRFLNELGYDARTADTQYEGELAEMEAKQEEPEERD